MFVILCLCGVYLFLLHYDTFLCMKFAMLITHVGNEIYKLSLPWTHDLNVWSWLCVSNFDCDYGMILWIGFPRSSTNIVSGFQAPTQLLDRVSTFHYNYEIKLPRTDKLNFWVWVPLEDQWCDDKIWNVLLILRVDNVVCVDIYAWDYNFVYVVFVASLCCT